MNDSHLDLSHLLPDGAAPTDGLERLKRRAGQRMRVRRSLATVPVILVVVATGVVVTSTGQRDQHVAQQAPSPTTSPAASTTSNFAGITTTTVPTGDYTTTTSNAVRDWSGTRFTQTPAELKEEGETDTTLANGTAMLISEISDSNRSYFWSSRQIGTSNGSPLWQVVSSIPLSGVDPPACIGTCVSKNGTRGDSTVAVFSSRFGNSPAVAAWTMNTSSGILEATNSSNWTRM